MGKKVIIYIIETDGLKAALEAEPEMYAIIKRLRPYLATYSIIKLDDFKIKQQPNIAEKLPLLIKEFLDAY